MNQEALDEIAAIIGSGDVSALPVPAQMPEGAAGQIMLAMRAAGRLRDEVTEAIACSCYGTLEIALTLIAEAERDLATMRKRLTAANDLAHEAARHATREG